MKKLIIPILIIISILSSCSDDIFFENDRITGTGEIRTEVIPVSDFSSIDLECVANVYVNVGTPREVRFTAYENILPVMEARVIGDELLLQFNTDNEINTDKEIRIDITTETLEKVTLSGVGNFTLTGPSQQSLDIELNGVGNIFAYELPVYHATVEINGVGNVEVRSKETLYVDIDGMGNVYYLEDPVIIADISGMGEVLRGQ
ncbi:MAG: DUF2807 domain-containing protein [Bacteroidales bacterium]|nr:DUF2807 domain-containing protein [Bacteroidales bacterium]